MIRVKTISNLIKVFPKEEPESEISHASILKNETFSYQISIFSDKNQLVDIKLESSLSKCISLRKVNYIHANLLFFVDNDDDYVLKDKKTPTDFPDLLTPIDSKIELKKDEWTTIYVTLKNVMVPGNFDITFSLLNDNKVIGASKLNIEVINKEINLDKILPNTNWFHYDAIANYYRLNVFSEKYNHNMIDFLKDQRSHGINMLFVPLFTPPLDTKPGLYRRTAQLVDVEVKNDKYKFNFDRVFIFLELGRKLGYKYFEMSHLFSQWGAKNAPKVMAKVNGKTKRIFGWRNKSNGEYLDFVIKFLKEFVNKLRSKGYKENEIYFHISDEPNTDSLKTYQELSKKVRKVINPYKTFDALSDYEFYKKHIVDEPVVAEDHVNEYRKNNVKSFVYYCCCEAHNNVPNRFMNMSLNRLRILGSIMYADDAKGLLQWGYNFYNSQLSINRIDPFLIPDANARFPAGDAFIVYPGKDGKPLNSIRGETYFDSLQDYALLKMLEDKRGIKFTKDLLNKYKIFNYEDYPKDDNFCFKFHERIIQELK